MWERILRFGLGAFAIHLLLWGLFAWVATHHDTQRMDARWLQGPVPAEVMVAGDSHARFAVEAPLIAGINLAVPGEHYLKSRYRVPWLLDHGTRPVGTVLVPFDCTSFSSFKSDSFEPEYLWDRYVDWRALAVLRGEPLLYLGKFLKARFAPYIGEADSVFQYVTRSRHFRDPEVQSGLMPADLEDGITTAARHFADAEPWDPDQVVALKGLVDELRARDIMVVLVRYPLRRDYLTAAARYGADDGHLRDALFAELSAQGGVHEVDFEHTLKDRADLFSDADHLNMDGKRVFTGLLAHSLYDLGLVTAPRWDILNRPVTR